MSPLLYERPPRVELGNDKAELAAHLIVMASALYPAIPFGIALYIAVECYRKSVSPMDIFNAFQELPSEILDLKCTEILWRAGMAHIKKDVQVSGNMGRIELLELMYSNFIDASNYFKVIQVADNLDRCDEIFGPMWEKCCRIVEKYKKDGQKDEAKHIKRMWANASKEYLYGRDGLELSNFRSL